MDDYDLATNESRGQTNPPYVTHGRPSSHPQSRSHHQGYLQQHQHVSTYIPLHTPSPRPVIPSPATLQVAACSSATTPGIGVSTPTEDLSTMNALQHLQSSATQSDFTAMGHGQMLGGGHTSTEDSQHLHPQPEYSQFQQHYHDAAGVGGNAPIDSQLSHRTSSMENPQSRHPGSANHTVGDGGTFGSQSEGGSQSTVKSRGDHSAKTSHRHGQTQRQGRTVRHHSSTSTQGETAGQRSYSIGSGIQPRAKQYGHVHGYTHVHQQQQQHQQQQPYMTPHGQIQQNLMSYQSLPAMMAPAPEPMFAPPAPTSVLLSQAHALLSNWSGFHRSLSQNKYDSRLSFLEALHNWLQPYLFSPAPASQLLPQMIPILFGEIEKLFTHLDNLETKQMLGADHIVQEVHDVLTRLDSQFTAVAPEIAVAMPTPIKQSVKLDTYAAAAEKSHLKSGPSLSDRSERRTSRAPSLDTPPSTSAANNAATQPTEESLVEQAPEAEVGASAKASPSTPASASTSMTDEEGAKADAGGIVTRAGRVSKRPKRG